ncbi:MAG: phosphoribosyltransferase [Candidatus Hydrothermarchaeales archaeon]
MEYLRLSWAEIQEQCEILARWIKTRGYDKYAIVGLARGGWVPARILSDLLDNKELYTLTVQFYKSVGKTREKPVVVQPVQGDIAGKDILLVDDIADTGESLIAAAEHLKERGAGDIIVATLVKKPHTKFEPDFCVEETSAWVIFPWEVRETVRDIISSSKSEENLAQEMRKARISDEERKEVLRETEGY